MMVSEILEPLLLTSILAASDDGVIAWSEAGKILRFNSAAERLLGFSARELIGTAVDALLSEDTRSRALRARSFVSASVRTGPGTQIDVLARLDEVNDAAGRRVATFALLRPAPGVEVDWDDGERLNWALTAARLGDWSWDARSDVVTFSARAAEIFGIPAGPHMTWTAMRELLHPDDREKARLAVEHAVRGRENYQLQYRVINGTRERWVYACGRARYDAQGAPLGLYGVVQDISTDRLLVLVDDAVRPLVKSEDITYTAARLLGQYLNVDRCAYAFVDDDEDTFTLTGNYTRGVPSIVGRYQFRQFGAECLRCMRAGEAYVVEDSENDPRIDEEERKSYARTTIRAVICVPIQKSGRFVAAMAVHAQTTRKWTSSEVEIVQQVASRCWESIERARVERERERLLEAAEAANRAKDEFLAMLGHELRNPLAPILTALHVMKLKHDGSSERERTIIERQVTHLTRLVDDLLDVSRIARAKVALKHEYVEISEVVRRAVEVASPLLEQRTHTLVLEVPRQDLLVNGDVARLTQVVSNLLSNACKYTAPGGRIKISASARDDAVVLSVQDNGIGMTPDVLPHVFDLFVQGRQAIDRAQGGLGLGLSIVKSLVERHGGSVSAHSDGLERGSEFIVRLPQAHPNSAIEQSAPNPPSSEPEPAGRGLKVLVVDDNEDAAEMLGCALSLQGCDVRVAHDGPSALNLASDRFDAALLDIGLPVMDGYELAARLKELPHWANTRLIAVTGYGQDSDRKRALSVGFHEHLVKPVGFEVLQALVKKLATSAAVA
jgi:PAS domain S-box-containing protein